MRKRAIVICVMVLAAAAQSSSADGPWGPAPALPSLERAAAYFDSAQLELDDFMKAICRGRADEAESALTNYMRNISRLHIQLAALRIGKQDRAFVGMTAQQLKLQKSQLEPMAQFVPPGAQFALIEAAEHLDRVIQVAEEKLDGQVPTFKWYGYSPKGAERWRVQR